MKNIILIAVAAGLVGCATHKKPATVTAVSPFTKRAPVISAVPATPVVQPFLFGFQKPAVPAASTKRAARIIVNPFAKRAARSVVKAPMKRVIKPAVKRTNKPAVKPVIKTAIKPAVKKPGCVGQK